MNIDIAQATPAEIEAALPDLIEILHASVHAGASIGFVLPFPLAESEAFWRSLLPAFTAGDRLLFLARLDGRIVGTAQLILAGMPNGRHRAEIAKVMVHPSARRRGLARALMLAAEAAARAHARRLLLLDTTTGRDAERLYTALGYATIGVIPAYAADPDGSIHPTTIMAKDLADA
jgi:GNAT superfamily N-acetyltransferase